MTNTPNLRRLEIDITYICGLNCHNCNRMTGIAPGLSHQNLSPKVLKDILNNFALAQHPWERFAILGGEPTRHPQFFLILHIIEEYRKTYNQNLEILLASHGIGQETRRILGLVRDQFPRFKILETPKEKFNAEFAAVCLAPIDLHPEWASDFLYDGCPVSWHCGIGLNYKGFYPCAVAGAIDRIFQFDKALNLNEINEEELRKRYQIFCPLCGHYQPIKLNDKTWLSPSWRRALDNYHSSVNFSSFDDSCAFPAITRNNADT